jgi:hypothetical protein
LPLTWRAGLVYFGVGEQEQSGRLLFENGLKLEAIEQMDCHAMLRSGSKSVYALLGIAGALVGESIADVLGFNLLSIGWISGIILGAVFFIIGWRQLQPP